MDTLLEIKKIKRMPSVHQHNDFAKLIEEIHRDDFIYDNHWKNKENEHFERISSSKFCEIIFDKKGKLAKYILDEIKKVIISEDQEEMERLIDIKKYLFQFKNKNNKNCIEREYRDVFYCRDSRDRGLKDYNEKSSQNHKKYNYLCQHNIVKVLKYVNIKK